MKKQIKIFVAAISENKKEKQNYDKMLKKVKIYQNKVIQLG